MDPVFFIIIISMLGPIIGSAIGATAGLMIYITADELIPNSCAGTNHQTIFSLIIGVIFVILLGLV